MSINPPSQTSRKRVFLVDDHPLVRLGIGQLIDRQEDLMVCGEAEDARGALEGVGRLKPDAIVLDLTLKDSDGLEVVKNINAQYPAIPVLVLSIHPDSIYAALALRAGAKGYVMKSEPLATVVAAIRRVIAGGIHVSESIASHLLQQQARGPTTAESSPLERLSDRERQVLHLIGQWHTTRQIAKELHLSIKTVEHHREKLKTKLNLGSAAALVQYAVNLTQNPPRHSPDNGSSSRD